MYVTCAMNWVVGGLKLSFSGVCAPAFSPSQCLPDFLRTRSSSKVREAVEFVRDNLSLFLQCANICSQWSSPCLNLFRRDDTDCKVHWFKWAQMSFISWRKHLFKSASCVWSVVYSLRCTVYHRSGRINCQGNNGYSIWNISVRLAAYFTEYTEYSLHFLF